MVESFADAGLALEAIEEDGIGFHIGVGNLQGHHPVVAHIRGAKDGCHPAAGNGRLDAVIVDLRTGF